MDVAITGGAGFLGTCLARQLLQRNTLVADDGTQQPISRITLLDVVPATGIDDSRIRVLTGDIADPGIVAEAIGPDTHSIFHLAAVVSGQAEADFDLGMKINFDATRLILERARALRTRARVVFTSSVAVFGGELSIPVTDLTVLLPQSSYGTQKAMSEMLLNNYSRKGFVDGRALRMPTISVRPGAPNKAVSSFASGIIREPLNGVGSVCPVSPDTVMWLMSPRKAIDNLIHGHEIDGAGFGESRALSMPGLSVTVAEMVEALECVAGSAAAKLIRWEPDAAVMRIVNSWPGNFVTARADALGFCRDTRFEDIVRAYIEDDLRDVPPS